MPTQYEPSDGDYIEEDYTKFFNDIQAEAGYDFGEYLEICADLNHDDLIRVMGSNSEGDEWIWHDRFIIPKGWSVERVKEMFQGYVYLKPKKSQ